jgi:hypothetical protein
MKRPSNSVPAALINLKKVQKPLKKQRLPNLRSQNLKKQSSKQNQQVIQMSS